MSKNILEIEIFSAWNTYAITMMSVLENCDMWCKTDTFQKFMCETGIAVQFCVDKNCSPLSITDYDWINEHTSFMERIGIQTKKYYSDPQDPMYSVTQQEAVQAIKNAIDNKIASVVWGIDTGEFGVIYGYDDEDKVFYTKGIGSQNTNASLPILYNNLGKTFEYAPVLYCEIPQSLHDVNPEQAFVNFLNLYVQEMNRISDNEERVYGFAAYDMLMKAIQEGNFNEFGLRYCVGVYYERKDAILQYLLERKKDDLNDLLCQLIDSFHGTVRLYRNLMYEILQEGTDGWNYLSQPIRKECYSEMMKILHEIKLSEKKNVTIVEQMLAMHTK